MILHEGSVGDRMAWLKGGKLQLQDVLRCFFFFLGSKSFIYILK